MSETPGLPNLVELERNRVAPVRRGISEHDRQAAAGTHLYDATCVECEPMSQHHPSCCGACDVCFRVCSADH